MQVSDIHTEFLSAAETMDLLGLSRQLLAWKSENVTGFPKPEPDKLYNILRVYRRSAVMEWLAANPRKPKRKKPRA